MSKVFNVGDKVRFIDDVKLNHFANKTGIIERKLEDDEIIFEDEELIGQRAYEVWIPAHGNVCVLESFIESVSE